MAKGNAPYVTNVTGGFSDDGKSLILQLGTTREPLAVAFGWADVPKLVNLPLRVAEDAAKKFPGEPLREGRAVVYPIAVRGLGVMPGRSPSEAVLTADLGTMKLSLAVELERLFALLELLRSNTEEGPIRPPH